MKNLHQIQPSLMLSDMLKANLWHVMKIYKPERLRFTTLPRISGYTPILIKNGDMWWNWYEEPRRLDQWDEAGRPEPSLFGIEVGSFKGRV